MGTVAVRCLSRIVLGGAVLLLSARVAPSQGQQGFPGSASTSGQQNRTSMMETRIEPPNYFEPVTTGQPYSVTQLQERVQLLADGTHITSKFPAIQMYRDSLGRTRLERPMGINGKDDGILVTIEIRDPVAGYAYILEVQQRIAHRYVFESPETRRTTAPPPLPVSPLPIVGDFARPTVTRENLGTQSMEGVECQASRTTSTWPIGSINNDREIVSVTETCNSPYFRMPVLLKRSDPRMGDSTLRLTNINLSEPDFALFQLPAGYSVVDEKGQITIRYYVTRQ